MVGIIGFNDLHLMQFLNKYTYILDANNIEYDVIYWNRSNGYGDKNFKGNTIPYNYSMNNYMPFYMKIGGFLRYTFFMRKIIKQNKYEKLIILTTQTAIPLYDLLTRKYVDKYIFDYRDITKEKKLSFYAKMVKKLFQKSYKAMISSKGFLNEIGVEDTSKVAIAHNTQIACRKTEYLVKIHSDIPIRIVYWGMVRQYKHNKRMCDIFGNDMRFQLIYHGEGFYKELKEYCNQKQYKNIFFTGRYSASDIPSFIDDTDILNCVYENDAVQQSAMPVKAYDGIHYRLPMLIQRESFLEKFLGNICGVYSISTNINDKLTDEIFKWYHNLKKDEVEIGYRKIEEQVYDDDIYFSEIIKKFVEM